MIKKPTSLEVLRNREEPLFAYKWVCTELPYGHPLEYVESVDIPFHNIAIGDQVHLASSYIFFPGVHNVASFSMNFYEDRKGTSFKFILGWKKDIKDLNTGLYNLPTVYKKNIGINLLDFKDEVVIRIKMTGVWPADTQALPLTYTDTEGRIIIAQTFSIDNIEYPNL